MLVVIATVMRVRALGAVGGTFIRWPGAKRCAVDLCLGSFGWAGGI